MPISMGIGRTNHSVLGSVCNQRVFGTQALSYPHFNEITPSAIIIPSHCTEP